MDHRPPDRGRPYRHDPPHQARRQGLDQHLPRQARHREAGRDPHGLGQGQPRALGRRRQARAGSCSSCRTPTRSWPARPSSGPSRSCRSRPASSPARRRSDGQRQRAELRDLDDAEPRRAARRGQGQSCSTCASSTPPASSTTTPALGEAAQATSPASTPSSAAREIAAAEALETSEETPDGRRHRPTTEPDATAARSARASSPPTGMDKTAVVAVIDRVPPPAATARRCSAPRSSTPTTRPTTLKRRRPRPRRRRPARCRS